MIGKVPGAGGGLGRVFQAARTPCLKALWQEGARCVQGTVRK